MSMPIDNPNLPANHQDAGDVPQELEESVQEFDNSDPFSVALQVIYNPAITADMDKDALAHVYEALDSLEEEGEDASVEVKKAIFDLMEADSEEVGNYLCYYMEKQTYPELDLETARELGLTKTKEVIDTKLVRQAARAGVDLGKIEVNRIPVMRKKKPEEQE